MNGYTRIPFLKIFGARLHIHWSAFVVGGALFAFSIRDPVLALITICSYFALILLHEAGHAFVVRCLGYKPFDIQLGAIHGTCTYPQPHSQFEDALIAWGGVGAQLLVAVPLIIVAQFEWSSHVYGLGPVLAFLGYYSAMIVPLNLAPHPMLDGGKAWSLFPLLWKARRKIKVASNVIEGPWGKKNVNSNAKKSNE